MLFAVLFASTAGAEPRPVIVFSCWIPPSLPLHHRLKTLYVNAFDALGYDFEMHYRPNQRSLMEAKAGVSDGECARTAGYGRENPDSNLIRVNTQIASTYLEAWSNAPDRKLENIEALLNASYRIGYVRGHVAIQTIMEQFPQLHLTSVTSTEHGLKMLSAGRLDFFINTSVSTRQELDNLDLPTAVYPAGHLMTLRGHPYLNARHRALAEGLAEELQRRLPEKGWHFD